MFRPLKPESTQFAKNVLFYRSNLLTYIDLIFGFFSFRYIISIYRKGKPIEYKDLPVINPKWFQTTQDNFDKGMMEYFKNQSHDDKRPTSLLLFLVTKHLKKLWIIMFSSILIILSIRELNQYYTKELLDWTGDNPIDNPEKGRELLFAVPIFMFLVALTNDALGYIKIVSQIQLKNVLGNFIIQQILTIRGDLKEKYEFSRFFFIVNVKIGEFSSYYVTNALKIIQLFTLPISIYTYREWFSWKIGFYYTISHYIFNFLFVTIPRKLSQMDDLSRNHFLETYQNSFFDFLRNHRLIISLGWQDIFVSREVSDSGVLNRKMENVQNMNLRSIRNMHILNLSLFSNLVKELLMLFIIADGGEITLSSIFLVRIFMGTLDIILGLPLMIPNIVLNLFNPVIYLSSLMLVNPRTNTNDNLISNPISGNILSKGESIRFENFQRFWPQAGPRFDGTPLAIDIPKLSIPEGKFICVYGANGSGKTALGLGIVNELVFCKGSVITKFPPCYVPTEAFIFPGTVKENICCEFPYDSEKFKKVVAASGLEDDIENWTTGISHLIQESGGGISGGQATRVSIARALYKPNVYIYIFDDNISSLDSKKRKKIFSSLSSSNGLLAKKTKLFFTTNFKDCSGSDLTIIMDKGKISYYGKYDESLEKNYIDISKETNDDIIPKSTSSNSLMDEKDMKFYEEISFDSKLWNMREMILWGDILEDEEESNISLRVRSLSVTLSDFSSKHSMIKGKPRKTPLNKAQKNGNFLNKEYWIHTGDIKIDSNSIYQLFSFVKLFFCSLYIKMEVFKLISNIIETFLGLYISGAFIDSISNGMLERKYNINPIWLYFIIRGFVGLISYSLWNLNSLFQQRFFKYYSITIKMKLFQSIGYTSPFFSDFVTIGQIDNIFNYEVPKLSSFPALFGSVFSLIIRFYFYVILIMNNFNFFLGFSMGLIVPLSFYLLYRSNLLIYTKQLDNLGFKIGTSRSKNIQFLLRNVENIKLNGWFQHAYDFFKNENIELFTAHDLLNIHLYTFIDFITDGLFLIIKIILYISFILKAPTMVGKGKKISFLQMFDTLWVNAATLIHSTTSYAPMINSASRVMDIMTLPEENELLKNENSTESIISNAWPQVGRLTLDNFSIYYDDMKPVLSNLNITFEPKMRYGIVGHTGAGKSTLFSAFLLMVPKITGKISVDGVDMTSIPLKVVRRTFFLIPQKSSLFYGTLRFNLDPFGEFSDAKLRSSLRMVGLMSIFDLNFEGLDQIVGGKGKQSMSLTLAQQQLFCIARALLYSPPFVLFDEVNSALDERNDDIIHDIIMDRFQESTIFTIAHKLKSIIDYDSIIVMAHGKIVENGAPNELLSKPDSLFSSMIDSCNNSDDLRSLAGKAEKEKKISSFSRSMSLHRIPVSESINFPIENKHILFFGPSGSGKSTILKLIQLNNSTKRDLPNIYDRYQGSCLRIICKVFVEILHRLHIRKKIDGELTIISQILIQYLQNQVKKPPIGSMFQAWIHDAVKSEFRSLYYDKSSIEYKLLSNLPIILAEFDEFKTEYFFYGINKTFHVSNFTLPFENNKKLSFWDFPGSRDKRYLMKTLSKENTIDTLVYSVNSSSFNESENSLLEAVDLFISAINKNIFDNVKDVLIVFTHVDQMKKNVKNGLFKGIVSCNKSIPILTSTSDINDFKKGIENLFKKIFSLKRKKSLKCIWVNNFDSKNTYDIIIPNFIN